MKNAYFGALARRPNGASMRMSVTLGSSDGREILPGLQVSEILQMPDHFA